MRRRGVSPSIPQRFEASPFLGDRPQQVEEIPRGPCQSIEPGDDQEPHAHCWCDAGELCPRIRVKRFRVETRSKKPAISRDQIQVVASFGIRAGQMSTGFGIQPSNARTSSVLSFHSCRNGFATALLQAGVDPVTVAKLGGWKNVRHLFETYGHANDDATLTDKISGTDLTQPTHPISRKSHTIRTS